MTERYFPFDAGAGANVTEAQWRAMAQQWLSTGVLTGYLNELAVSQRAAGGAGMAVDVATGGAWLQGHYYDTDALLTKAIAAADPADDRIDRVVARLKTVDNLCEVAVLTGTPAGVPVAPALTQTTSVWEEALAQVAVGAAVTQILNADITDERTYATAPAAASGATVATTVAGLGAGTEGKVGWIRAGGTGGIADSWKLVVYDATYAKWLSTTTTRAFTFTGGTIYAAPATWSDVVNAAGAALFVFAYEPWAIFDTAGLVPQLRAAGFLQINAAGAAHMRPAHYWAEVDDAAPTGVGVTAIDLSSATPTSRFKDSGWVALTAGYVVKTYITPGVQVQGNGANATSMICTTLMRWVG